MNSRLLRLRSGRIVLPLCHLSEECLGKALETSGWSGCFFSDDEASSWSHGAWIEGARVGGHLAEPIAVETGAGSLMLFMRTGIGYLYRSKSSDEGETWTVEESSGLRSPCASFCVQTDPYSGFVFAVRNNSFPSETHQYPRSPLSLAVSRDNTESWEFISDIEEDPMSSYGYPALFFAEDTINVVYYENKGRRNFDSARQRLKQTILYRKNLSVRQERSVPLFG